MMSPRRKKRKVDQQKANKNKRENESEDSSNKRVKSVKVVEDDLQAKRRKNFITACKQVSCEAYFNHRTRLHLVYLPSCMKTIICKHHDKNITNINPMPNYAEESFMIEMKTNMWNEALEVCQMCITPTQFLSTNVLRGVVEIMLNAHDDEYLDYTVQEIIDKSQIVLAHNFSAHPPCLVKTLRKSYITFLTSPMDNKDNTFTNRKEFECEKGIVKYCMNRLEYEISAESNDGPLVNKCENTPEHLLQSVQGLHWQKEKFEIFEVLERTDRIDRLMAVLESIIELLQFDLGIWHSRYTNNFGCHIMRSHKPLIAHVLWSNNVLYTGAVNMNCRQILRLFVHMVYLQYPVNYIKTMATWLNIVVQTFYTCETNSNNDYPNIGKYCTTFANEFYKIITRMPEDAIIKIIEKIEPTFMRHLIGLMHIKELLKSKHDCIIKIMSDFVKNYQWKLFSTTDTEIILSKPLFPRPNSNRTLSSVLKKCLKLTLPLDDQEPPYPKMNLDPKMSHNTSCININHIVHTMYITLDAFLDTYNVQHTQETWEKLNEQLLQDPAIEDESMGEYTSYTVTESYIKKYRYIYQEIKELVLILRETKTKEQLPSVFNIFSNIGLLEI